MIRTKNSPPPPSHLRSARTYSGVSFREVSLVLKCSLDIYIHNISSFYPARRRTIRFILIRLLCNSDPVLNTFRKITKSKCKKCVESEPSTNPLSDQDSLFSCLTCINP